MEVVFRVEDRPEQRPVAAAHVDDRANPAPVVGGRDRDVLVASQLAEHGVERRVKLWAGMCVVPERDAVGLLEARFPGAETMLHATVLAPDVVCREEEGKVAHAAWAIAKQFRRRR